MEILEEVHLGHFTFTKFLMWKDLHENESELVRIASCSTLRTTI